MAFSFLDNGLYKSHEKKLTKRLSYAPKLPNTGNFTFIYLQ